MCLLGNFIQAEITFTIYFQTKKILEEVTFRIR